MLATPSAAFAIPPLPQEPNPVGELAFQSSDDNIEVALLSSPFKGIAVPPLSPDRQLRIFSRVFEDLTDPVIVQDMSGIIIDLNPEAEASYGWTRKELLGQSASVLFSVSTDNQHQELLDQCCRGELVRNVESVRVTKSGNKRFVLLTMSLLTTEQGEPFAIATIAKDITDLKQANTALVRAGQEARRQASQLRRTNEKLNDFVRMCSHDLQAPLRAVENFVSLIRKKYYNKLNSDGNEYIDFVTEGTVGMKRLITDLLDYARSDSEEVEITELDCKTIIERALVNLRADIDEAEAKVVFDQLPVISGDETQLIRLFQNLIGNAIVYRRDVPPEIRIEVKSCEDHWLFRVMDNGIGIPPDKVDEIFKPFNRLDQSSQRKGTGIGLATCKNVVERHGGQLWVESKPAEGSVFCFTIPYPIAEDVA